jgi:hypothetical protein
MKKLIAFAFTFVFYLSTQHAIAQSTGEMKNLVEKVAKLSVVSANSNHTKNDWSAVEKNFSKGLWTKTTDKKFSDAMIANPNKSTELFARGSRSMIIESGITFIGDETKIDLYRILSQIGSITEVRCDSRELSSYSQRVIEIKLPNSKPINAVYEVSSGSGGVMQTIKLSNSIAMPKIGSQAMNEVWIKKCN